jgi:hypothetical protein
MVAMYALFPDLRGMTGKRAHINIKETEDIRFLAEAMAAKEGPFTRKQMAMLLYERHQKISLQELLNLVSTALNDDKHCNSRFALTKPGWWDLAEKESPNSNKSGPE